MSKKFVGKLSEMKFRNKIDRIYLMKKSKVTLFLLLIIWNVFVLTNSCNSKIEQSETADYYWDKNEIIFSDNSNIITQLKIEKAQLQLVESNLNSPGIVKTIPEHFAQVASPFAGRVVKSFVLLGQQVKKGAPIFEIKSADFFVAQQEYLAAQQELKQAEINLKRQKDLFDHAVGVKRELEEAQTDFKIKKIAVDQAAASVKVFNTSSQIVMGQSLMVRSPISGQIIKNELVTGQYLKEDHEALVTVADLSKVWVTVQIKEHNLGFLKELKRISFTVEAFPTIVFDGKIIHIGQTLNEESRSVEVLIETENNQFLLKPGMYVNVVLKGFGKEEIILPSKAVFQDKADQYVFVKIDEKKYHKTKVVAIGHSEDNHLVRVTDGLKAGDKVVVDGGVFLMGVK